MKIVKKLIVLANKLDSIGQISNANFVDNITKLAKDEEDEEQMDAFVQLDKKWNCPLCNMEFSNAMLRPTVKAINHARIVHKFPTVATDALFEILYTYFNDADYLYNVPNPEQQVLLDALFENNIKEISTLTDNANKTKEHIHMNQLMGRRLSKRIEQFISLANILDANGFINEANYIDNIIIMASSPAYDELSDWDNEKLLPTTFNEEAGTENEKSVFSDDIFDVLEQVPLDVDEIDPDSAKTRLYMHGVPDADDIDADDPPGNFWTGEDDEYYSNEVEKEQQKRIRDWKDLASERFLLNNNRIQ